MRQPIPKGLGVLFGSALLLAGQHATAQTHTSIRDAVLAESGQTTSEISTEELTRFLADSNATVFDARPRAEYAISHIPGARNGEARSAFWSLLVLPGPPVQLGPPSGSDQSGSVGQPLGQRLSVTVQDQFGNGVDGQAVSWTVTSGGGTLAESTTASNRDGLHLNIWTLGPTPGVQTVAASFGGVTVTFTAHASSGS